MSLIITSLILLLATYVRCSEFVDKYNASVDFEKECGPRSKPCVVKCCGPDEVMHAIEQYNFVCKSLHKLEKELNLTDYNFTSYPGIKIMTIDGENSTKELLTDFRVLYLNDSYNPKQFPKSVADLWGIEMEMIENGSFFYNEFGIIMPSMYCFEKLIGIKPETQKLLEAYIYSVRIDDTTNDRIEDMFFGFCSLISAFFLLLTLAVYALVKDLHDKLNGVMMMVFVASLMSVALTVSGKRFYDLKLRDENKYDWEYCWWLSPLMFFLIHSTFFWINTMSFDIWLTFRDSLKDKRRHSGFRVKFLRYALYAWGFPALLTIVAVLIDKYAPDDVIKPNFDTCSTSISESSFYSPTLYHHLPMIIMISANIIMYLLTVYNMWVVKRDLKNPNFSSNKSKKKKNQFVVFFKLATIMGLNWLIELIESLVPHRLPMWLFLIVNSYTAFLGVLIFYILVIKKTVIRKLCKRFGIENRWTRRSTNMKTTSRSLTMTKMRTNDDSIEFGSINVSNADTLREGDQTPRNVTFQTKGL